MASNESEYLIKLRTDAELAGLKKSQDEFKQLSASAKAAGISTDGLDKELAEVNAKLGNRAIEIYRTHLKDLIDTEKAAGRSTDDLVKRLVAVQRASEDAGQSTSNLRRSVEDISQGTSKATSGLGSLAQSIGSLSGLAKGGGLALVATAVAGTVSAYASLISKGIEFNKTTGDAELAIGKVLQKFQNLDEAGARAKAANVMERIVELEPKTSATLEGLIEGFLATVAAAQSAGVTIEQNVDLVGRFANALANANIPAEQLTQELRAIFTGNITPDAALAKILQIDNATVEKAKQAGQLYQVLVEKMGALGEAGDSTAVRLSTLESTIGKVAGQVAKPIFDLFVDGLETLNTSLNDSTTLIAGLVAVSEGLAGIVRLSQEIAGAILQPGETVYGKATRELAALSKANAEQLSQLRAQIAAADTLTEKAAVRAKLEEAIAFATSKLADPNQKNKEALEQQIHFLERMVETLETTAGKVRQVTAAEVARTAELKKQVELTEEQKKRMDAIADSLADRRFDNLGAKELNGQLGAAVANVRGLFRDAGIQNDFLPGFKATADEIEKLTRYVDDSAKPAIFEQIATIKKLEDAIKRLTPAAKEAAKAATDGTGETNKALKEQLGLVDDLQKKREELLKKAPTVDPNASASEFNKQLEAEAEHLRQLNQNAADQNRARANAADEFNIANVKNGPVVPQPTLGAPPAPAPAAVPGTAAVADTKALTETVSKAGENATAGLNDLAEAAKNGFDAVRVTAEAQAPEITAAAAAAKVALDGVTKATTAGYAQISTAAKDGAAQITDAVVELARSLQSELSRLAGRISALERRP